uniref:Uncharacterized protein n=1 Tax=Candidatus Kentrum sp. TC TaxID=2126339 RepID=A0A451AEV1_9GAMM|nr:MAG: hypothetical protein BECKTC1821F_GA0114240_11306 [Candidatus Kentron sp. TC]
MRYAHSCWRQLPPRYFRLGALLVVLSTDFGDPPVCVLCVQRIIHHESIGCADIQVSEKYIPKKPLSAQGTLRLDPGAKRCSRPFLNTRGSPNEAMRSCIGKIKFLRNQVKEKVGNLETKINFGEKHEGARLVINQEFFAKLPKKGRNKGVARQGIKKRLCVIPS